MSDLLARRRGDQVIIRAQTKVTSHSFLLSSACSLPFQTCFSGFELQHALQQVKAECERSQTDSVWSPEELEMLGRLNEDVLEDLFCESLKNSSWQYVHTSCFFCFYVALFLFLNPISFRSFRSKIMQIYPFYQRASLLCSDARLHGKLAELLMVQTRVRPELLQYCLENDHGGALLRCKHVF